MAQTPGAAQAPLTLDCLSDSGRCQGSRGPTLSWRVLTLGGGADELAVLDVLEARLLDPDECGVGGELDLLGLAVIRLHGDRRVRHALHRAADVSLA